MSEEWRDQAACRGFDPDFFFPERGEPVEHIIAVCDGCPVKEPCLAYAFAAHERDGIWGGLSSNQRRKYRNEGRTLRVDHRKEIRHGTEAGYRRHVREKVSPCVECRLAHSKSEMRYRANRRAAS